jgi:HD-GYP domain-containing protein (c-di-GMP phosphodiesterase class II)
MKFPVLKKEIHLRFLGRIAAIFLLSASVISVATLILEYRGLKSSLLRSAVQESSAIAALFEIYYSPDNPTDTTALQMHVATRLERTPFIQADFFNDSRDPLFSTTREGGAPIAEEFVKKMGQADFTATPEGHTLYTNKRIYLRATIPFQQTGTETTAGYMKTIYKVSLDDMRSIFQRVLSTLLIGIGGVLLCSILMYLGMIFMNNRLISNSAELNRANGFLLRALGAALARVDTGDVRHNHRILIYGVRLAEKQGRSRTQIRSLIMGSFLHDIGMLSIDTSTLQKPSGLDEEERKQISQHPRTGGSWLKKIHWLRPGLSIVKSHHEKYDGSGYPVGTSHDKIPFDARIFAIVDAFDALTSDRFYRKQLEVHAALGVLEQGSGVHFDPVILSAFVEIAPPLHTVVSNLELNKLDRELDKVLKKYFKS